MQFNIKLQNQVNLYKNPFRSSLQQKNITQYTVVRICIFSTTNAMYCSAVMKKFVKGNFLKMKHEDPLLIRNSRCFA